ncbi:MAG: hypothetical protein HXX08_10540 [Chloroflexi bacterium]|uniref:Uncharacterized protein n=1 Tax=Candidatus Chlorohelix allophototropha TaxID=3003348 RepID=A0A8T7LZ08_9CHLR|nr:hypothetical protein [Chloroflexota bacterium]WJW65674.1 hypothetical protein OZ401_001452 [Chloroflexota bacterium L227-S17]
MSDSQNTNPAQQGCSVDWSWLEGRKIAGVWNDLNSLVITFEDGLVFKIQAANYKGDAFLMFNPYKDPAK